MPGRNCAFFGCPTSQKHKLSLFQIPVVSAKQSEYTAAIKKKSREEWLKIILRTREMTPELKTRIDNNIYVCESLSIGFWGIVLCTMPQNPIDRLSQTYILLSIRVFSSGVISLVLKMILSHSSRLFFFIAAVYSLCFALTTGI